MVESIYAQFTKLYPEVVAEHNAKNGSVLAREPNALGLETRAKVSF